MATSVPGAAEDPRGRDAQPAPSTARANPSNDEIRWLTGGVLKPLPHVISERRDSDRRMVSPEPEREPPALSRSSFQLELELELEMLNARSSRSGSGLS